MLAAILGKCDLAHIPDTEKQALLYHTKAMYLFSHTLKSCYNSKSKATDWYLDMSGQKTQWLL